MNNQPTDANYVDNGPSTIIWLRIDDFIHDYWDGFRWVTFEGGHNKIRSHWIQIN